MSGRKFVLFSVEGLENEYQCYLEKYGVYAFFLKKGSRRFDRIRKSCVVGRNIILSENLWSTLEQHHIVNDICFNEEDTEFSL